MLDREIALGLGRAEQRLELGDNQGAVEALRRVLAQDPSLSVAHALLALALLGRKRLAAAEHEASMALAMEPESPLAHRVLGLALTGQRKMHRARQHLDQAVLLAPEDALSHRAQAVFHAVRNDRKAERGALERACELEPDDPDNLAALGRWFLHEGSLEEAERLGRDALASTPEHPASLVLIGHVLLARGRTEDAREHALWALRNRPDDDQALRLLAAVKARQSYLLGLWWRGNAWLTRRGDSGAALILTFAYGLQRVLVMAAEDKGLSLTAEIVTYAWLAVCVYSWVGPAMFQRSVRAELRQVRLADDF